jgi:hypothetical protein
VHRPHARGFEDFGKRAFEYVAAFEDVGDAGRAAQVVLEDVNLSVAVTHEIAAGDVTPNAARRMQSFARLAQ